MVMAILGLYKPPFKKSFVFIYIVIAFCLGSPVIFFFLDTCVQFIKTVLVKCLNFEFTGWV